MLENFIYFSPVWILIVSLIGLLLRSSDNSSQQFNFRIAKIFSLISFGLSIIFYNKVAFPEFINTNSFVMLFRIILYGSIFAILFLSQKWYSSMNTSARLFCEGIIISLIFGNILLMSANIIVTGTAIIGLFIAGYILYLHADKKKELYLSAKLYGLFALIFSFILIFAIFLLYKETSSLSYSDISNYLKIYTDNFKIFTVLSLFLLVFLFMIALVPLHFWFTETMGQIILPVFTYFILVPPVLGVATIVRWNIIVLGPYTELFSVFYRIVALLSVVIGALGACSGKNIRKIFSYSSIYHLGIIFLMLQQFDVLSLNNAFIYLFIYLLSMLGICTSLFGLKIKGEYLFMISDIEGASQKRPYISAIMTAIMFSLIGFPPFLGFLGLFTIFDELIRISGYYQLGIIIFSLVIISYAYLQIIKALYFETSRENFDRADIGIYIALLINIVIMIIITLNPKYLLLDINNMLEGAFVWNF